MSDVVIFERLNLAAGGELGLVTLNSEKTLNSLSLEMIDLMLPQLELWQSDDAIKAVLFKSAGEKAFCAGGDIQNLYHDMAEHPGGPCPYCETFFEREYRLDYLIHNYAKPTLVWGHGIVMGGGLGVLSACEYRIGTEKTRIAMPEITIGLFPDAGASYTFTKMAQHFAYFLAWTGANINGPDAKLVGFVDALISHSQKQLFVDALVELKEFGGSAIEALILEFSQNQDSINVMPEGNLQRIESIIEPVISAALGSDNPVVYFSDHLASFEKDKFLARAAATFRNGTPTTAQIIHKQLQLAKGMNLKQMFQMELAIAVQCSRFSDFAEGVRALLIDKDMQPKWQYPIMGAVPTDVIDAHFVGPWSENPLSNLPDSRKA